MKNVCPTIWSNFLQTNHHLDLPFVLPEKSTMNERLNIQASAALSLGEKPGMKVLVIGNGGHRAVTGADGFPLIDIIDHEADHAAPYNPIPFVLRNIDDDLTAGERANYALRTEVTLDGINYIAYYGKRINLNDVTVEIKKTIVEDGVSSTAPYVTSNANLYPTAPELSVNGTVTTSGEYLSTSAILSVPFTENDVAELVNVARIMYNDERYAVISEMCFCTAVDRTVSISTLNGQVNFREVVGCQVATFVGCHYEMLFNSKGFDFRIETGAVEPMLGAAEITTAVVSG